MSTASSSSGFSGGANNSSDIIPSLLQPIPTQALVMTKDKNPFLNDDDENPPSLTLPSSQPVLPPSVSMQPLQILQPTQRQQNTQPSLPPLPVSYQTNQTSSASLKNFTGEFQQSQPILQQVISKSNASPARPPRPSAPPSRPPPPNVSGSVPFVADFSNMGGPVTGGPKASGTKPVKSAFDDLEDTMRLALGTTVKGGADGGDANHTVGGQSMFVTSSGFGGSFQQEQLQQHSTFVLGPV